MIVHVQRKWGNFTQVDNGLINDTRLSFQAKGLVLYLLSKTPEWRPIVKQLADVGPDGAHAVRSAIDELVTAGYARRLRVTNPKTGRVIEWRLVVFECARDGQRYEEGTTVSESTLRKPESGEPTMRFSTSGFSTSGKPNATKDSIEHKTEDTKDASSFAYAQEDAVPCDGTGSSEGEINEGDLRNREDDQAGETQEMALEGEGVQPDPRQFPWRQVAAVMKRELPEIPLPSRPADRRDGRMKAFWKRNGHSIAVFELLASKIRESDYVMARGGHTGNNGKPYPWGWIFEKNRDGKVRADVIIEGGYSNEKMAFVLDRQAKADARAATITVMIVGKNTPQTINTLEQHNGSPRFSKMGEHANGMPVYIDERG